MNAPDLHIRTYKPDDLDAVVALWAACDLTRPWNSPIHDIAFCMDGPSSTLFIGERAGTIVATAMVGHDGHRGWIYYLATAPDLQRQGIGGKMVTHAEDWLREQGVGKLNLMIRDDNETVRDFYISIGYEAEPRIVMAKHLKDGKK